MVGPGERENDFRSFYPRRLSFDSVLLFSPGWVDGIYGTRNARAGDTCRYFLTSLMQLFSWNAIRSGSKVPLGCQRTACLGTRHAYPLTCE